MLAPDISKPIFMISGSKGIIQKAVKSLPDDDSYRKKIEFAITASGTSDSEVQLTHVYWSIIVDLLNEALKNHQANPTVRTIISGLVESIREQIGKFSDN